MVRFLFAFAVLFAVPVHAARTEVAVPGISGPVRFAYDSTTKRFIIEVDQRDVLSVGRLLPDPAGFIVNFDEGAGKGLNMIQTDGTAFSDTANEFNFINYGGYRFLHSPTVSGGATVPIGVATGLDLSDGNATDNDVDEFFAGGVLGASGRAFTVGRDPAFYTCATFNMADAGDANELLVGFQAPGSTAVTAVPQNATLGSHINYALIGNYDTAQNCTTACPIYMLTGIAGTDVATDTTDVFADATDYKLCVYISGAGVTTYKKNGEAPTVVAAATMADGVQLVPYIKVLQNGTDNADIILKSWEAGFTETD